VFGDARCARRYSRYSSAGRERTPPRHPGPGRSPLRTRPPHRTPQDPRGMRKLLSVAMCSECSDLRGVSVAIAVQDGVTFPARGWRPIRSGNWTARRWRGREHDLAGWSSGATTAVWRRR
jgi:hypothetical protein